MQTQQEDSNADIYHPAYELKAKNSIKPKFNKLFSNKLFGLIDDRFARSNMDKSKQEFTKKYGIPQDSKIYHYSCKENYKIGNAYRNEFSQPHEQELSRLEHREVKQIMGLGIFTVLYGAVSVSSRIGPKWSRLTAGNRVQYLLVYSLLLQAVNYIQMSHLLDTFDVVLKYNKFYEAALTKF